MAEVQMNADAMGHLTYSLYNALNKFSNDPAAYMVQPQVGKITYGSNLYVGDNRLNTSGYFLQEWYGRGGEDFGSSPVALGAFYDGISDSIRGGKGSDLIYGGWGKQDDYLGGGDRIGIP